MAQTPPLLPCVCVGPQSKAPPPVDSGRPPFVGRRHSVCRRPTRPSKVTEMSCMKMWVWNVDYVYWRVYGWPGPIHSIEFSWTSRVSVRFQKSPLNRPGKQSNCVKFLSNMAQINHANTQLSKIKHDFQISLTVLALQSQTDIGFKLINTTHEFVV